MSTPLWGGGSGRRSDGGAGREVLSRSSRDAQTPVPHGGPRKGGVGLGSLPAWPGQLPVISLTTALSKPGGSARPRAPALPGIPAAPGRPGGRLRPAPRPRPCRAGGSSGSAERAPPTAPGTSVPGLSLGAPPPGCRSRLLPRKALRGLRGCQFQPRPVWAGPPSPPPPSPALRERARPAASAAPTAEPTFFRGRARPCGCVRERA